MKLIDIILALLISSFFFLSCGDKEADSGANIIVQTAKDKILVNPTKAEPLITFVELGSVKCIPCLKMQPVMKAIEAKYTGQVKVIFYDIWKNDQKKYAQKYGIRLIPTQVFLDKNGKEIMRHEGFFSEAEIDVFLNEQGLTPKVKN